jgi:hydrogenase expression/formation protein HypE
MSHILLAHGSGGRAGRQLLEGLILKYLGNPQLNRLEDQAVLPSPAEGRLALTTDSYVIKPIFFPGGDIGRLAVCGTVNDLAVGGASPLYLSLGLIIEEGLELAELERVLASIQVACRETGVQVVSGDTKVVNRGAADKLFINTAGIGIVPEGLELGADCLQAGDKLILSGGLGEHALAVMLQREGLGLQTSLKSDLAPLNDLVASMLNSGAQIHAMRDPTRGGLAALLNEWAGQAKLGIMIEEEAIPLCDAVRGGCELLGLDPLYLANEGKLVVAVAAADADKLLTAMQQHPLAKEAAIIGEVVEGKAGQVVLQTGIGGQRLLTLPEGELLPRIC